MPSLDRSYWLAVALVTYVGMAGLQSASPSASSLGMMLLGPLALAWVWRRTEPQLVAPTVESAALVAARVVATSTVAWVYARQGTPGDPALDLAATIAAGSCGIAATYTLARIAPVKGILKPAKAARSVDASAFTGLLWGAALVVAGARFVAPEQTPVLDPLTLDYATTAASIGSLLVLIAASWRTRVLRELELGVGDRAEAAVVLSVTALSVAIPVAAIDVGPPDRVIPAALILASIGCCWTVLARDPASVSSVMRGALAVTLLGVPAALMAAVFTQKAPNQAGLMALIGCAACVFVGLIARNVARPLGPEQSRWLLAIAEANQSALDPEPNTAIGATLRSLQKACADPNAQPQLWRMDPPSVVSVDVAGYLHEHDADIPEGLVELGLAEPERTLRAETLDALRVRRPHVRPLLAWFEIRGGFSATVVLDEEGPTGFLLLPRGERRARMTLEEARATRMLADRLSSLLSVTSALARSRKRQLEAQQQAEHWKGQYDRARTVLDGQGARHAEFARTLARPLLTTAYSPAVRLTITEVEQKATQRTPMTLVAPSGTDVQAWAAVAHLHGKDRAGPLMCIDGGAEAREKPERWSNKDASPIALSRNGTLFIKDLHLLPLDMQVSLVDQITERAENDDMVPPALIVSLPIPVKQAAKKQQVLPALVSLLAGSEVQLPSLSERAEDLRALILDAISRAGGSHTATGIERAALQQLMDFLWPGNERQLRDVVERASQFADGPLLGLEALRAAGFPLEASGSSPPTTLEEDKPWSRPPPPKRPSHSRRNARRRG